MDTWIDMVNESREDALGITENNFLKWIEYNVGVKVKFTHSPYESEKKKFIEFLKEKYWDKFVESLDK